MRRLKNPSAQQGAQDLTTIFHLLLGRDSRSLLLSPSISFQEATEDSSLLQFEERLSEEMGELEVMQSPQKQPELPSSPAPTTEFQFYSDARGLVLILLGRSQIAVLQCC